MEWYAKVMSQYIDFEGRARRKEYWMFALFNFIVAFCLGFAVGLLKLPGFLPALYNLAVFFPSIAVGVRRMHDTNRSGWFLMIPFYNLYLLCIEGDRKPNQYGPDPKGTGPTTANKAA
jgi:uncharacterized membrane protein YhaH (DUF805 family)